MALTSTITSYDDRWPTLFQATLEQLAAAFGTEHVATHHVGSTAVEGLAAKPEIDVLIEVREHCNEAQRDAVLAGFGYVRGSDLTPGHHFYRRNVDGVRTHKLHICVTGHSQIERVLRFRDLLRADAVLRQRYQALKLELEASNTAGMGQYLAGKAPFIEMLLDKPGKACPVLLRRQGEQVQILAFRHPLAGYQLVKGSIEPDESAAQAAVRELAEESGLTGARIKCDLGVWPCGVDGQLWSLQCCEAVGPVPEHWRFTTADDGGRVFEFFWQPLEQDLPEPCHPVYQRALQQIRSRTAALPD